MNLWFVCGYAGGYTCQGTEAEDSKAVIITIYTYKPTTYNLQTYSLPVYVCTVMPVYRLFLVPNSGGMPLIIFKIFLFCATETCFTQFCAADSCTENSLLPDSIIKIVSNGVT